MPGRNSQELAQATAAARVALQSAEEQVRTIKRIADQLFKTSKGFAASGAEVLGGVLGASLFTALDITFMPFTTMSVATVPFVAIVGLCTGIFCARGRRGIRGDRERRESDLDERAQLRAVEDRIGLLEKAVKKGLLQKDLAQEQTVALLVKAFSGASAMPELPLRDQKLLGPADKIEDEDAERHHRTNVLR